MTTNRNNQSGGQTARIRTSGLLLAVVILMAGASKGHGDAQRWDVLATSRATYTNVTVTGKSGGNVFIRHEGGVANVKVEDLDSESREALGYAPIKSRRMSAAGGNSSVSQALGAVMEAVPVKKLQTATGWKIPPDARNFRPNPSVVIGLLTGLLLGYLFSCHCFGSICRKAGHAPGALIWIPGLQLIPLLRAAGMSGWWFLAFLVPVLNLVAHVLWSVNIVRARNKGMGWAVLLILPVTNLFALLYLAFSRTSSSDNEPRIQVVTPEPA